MTVLAGRSNHMEFNYLQRVKVYRLNDEGKWDDKGTGHVSVEYLEESEPLSYGSAIGHTHSLARWQSCENQRSDAVGLVVIDEEDNQTLLVHRISADDIYRRQEDTIISWTDPEVATDLALSFQETMGCSFIWDQICSVQRSIHFPAVGGLEGSARPVNDDLEHSGTSQDDGGGADTDELPPVELSALPQIAKTIGEVYSFTKERVASMVVRDKNYIQKLMELFHTCEDLEDAEGLRLMFKIVKGIIALNDGHLFDVIFSDEYIMDIVGALEYDPELTTRQDHRTFLKEHITFKEAVPICDPAILSKIHQTYRIGYIKDVILPRVLDDQTFATINSIMLFNNVSVVLSLQNDSVFLSELFSRLQAPDTPDKNRRDLVFFIQEFCNLSKHLQPTVRTQLFSALAKEGLFDIVKNILKHEEESVRLSGCDILIVVLNHDPTLLRQFLVQQPQNTLFSELVAGMLTHSEGGLQAQLLEIMRMLLDSETMDTVRSPPAQVDKSLFLDIFYEKYMDQMVQVLIGGCLPETGSREFPKDSPTEVGKAASSNVSPEILGNICELMCFCVQHHRFRIKYYVMRNHVVEKVLKLTRRKEKYLVVAAVRFLRTCIALKDEFYYRYIVKHNCFEPVIEAFVANGNRYNLLNSAVLELIDFIRKEGNKTLIVHLVETYSSKLESIDYVDTFKALKLKYEQVLGAPPASTAGDAVSSGGPDHGSRSIQDRLNQTSLPDIRKRKDERALDKDEEDYFNEDSDDEEDTATARVSTSSSPRSKPAVIVNGSTLGEVPFRGSTCGLVDYEDEDEDMPTAMGVNGKGGGGIFERKSDSVLLAIPISDPIWPDVEDVTVAKRKSPLAPSLEQTDATALKRQKPEEGQANEHSNDEAVSASVDNSPGVGPPTGSADVLGLESVRELSSVSISPQMSAASKTNANLGSCEKSRSDLLSSKETLVEYQGPGMYPPSSSDHGLDGGGTVSNPEVITATSVGGSHGDVDMVSRAVPFPGSVSPRNYTTTLLNDTPNSLQGPPGVESLKSSGRLENVSNPGPTEGSDRNNTMNISPRDAVVHGHETCCKSVDMDCKVADRVPSENGVGACLAENGNGTACEGSERVVHGIVSSKSSSGSNSGLSQQHNVSIGSEGNKLTSLGSDLMRAVTPTSPGPYTVR